MLKVTEFKGETKDLPKFDLVYEGPEYAIYQSRDKYSTDDFNYHLVMGIYDLGAMGEIKKNEKHQVEIHVVKDPKDLTDEQLKGVAETAGVEPSEVTPIDIHQCGPSAIVWTDKGPNRRKLLREARINTVVITGMLGFYLDQPRNAFGNTGWDFLDGTLGPKK